jgi:hypothetical protein
MKGIPAWAVVTMLKWKVADFCLNCQVFVTTRSEHCNGLHVNHKVIRLL